jgi:hypothetical protein
VEGRFWKTKQDAKAQEVKEMNSSPNQVVQSHRRLRHIAPGSFFGKFIGAGRDSRGTATHPLASRGIATELDRCQTGVSCGLAAAHLRCQHSGGAERSGRHRVSQTAGTRLGNRHYGFLPEIQPGCLFPPGQPPGPAGLLPLISTDNTDLKTVSW